MEDDDAEVGPPALAAAESAVGKVNDEDEEEMAGAAADVLAVELSTLVEFDVADDREESSDGIADEEASG